MTALKVTAHLSTPISFAEPIMLDAILEYRSCHVNKIGGDHLTRSDPAPEYGKIPIPIARKQIGGMLVPCCSSPVFVAEHEWHDHVAKRFPTEFARFLNREKLTKINTTGGKYKSFRLPLHCRLVDRVVWFAEGNRKPLLKLLSKVFALGKKRSIGYGRVMKWEAEPVDCDFSWFAERDGKQVLMRPLPVCDELPANLTGYRGDFGSVQSPYWHPERYCERVVPV